MEDVLIPAAVHQPVVGIQLNCVHKRPSSYSRNTLMLPTR